MIDWIQRERELRSDIVFLKQALQAKRIAQSLAPSAPSLPRYRAVSPVAANWANLADDGRRIVTQVKLAPEDKRTTIGKYSAEGESLRTIANNEREIRRLKVLIYITEHNAACLG